MPPPLGTQTRRATTTSLNTNKVDEISHELQELEQEIQPHLHKPSAKKQPQGFRRNE